MPTPTNLDALVSQFVTDIQQILKRKALEQVVAAIQVGEMPAPRRVAAKPTGKPTGKPIRRTSEDLAGVGEKLLAHVRSNPGQRGEQIAAALNTDVTTMRPAMHELIAAKQVRTEGQKRGMQYFVGGGGGGGRKGTRRGKRKVV